MAGENGLGTLEVGEAGDDGVLMTSAGLDQRLHPGGQKLVDPVESIAGPELGIGRHLIVTASSCVELAAGVAQFGDQGRLDVHVDIFFGDRIFEPASLDISLNFEQALFNRSSIWAWAMDPATSCL